MTTWYIWGGLVRWSWRSATTEPPSSSFGRVTGATGAGEGGFVAMKFILASGVSHRSLQVNWWRDRHIQASRASADLAGREGRARARNGRVKIPRPRKTLVCEILTETSRSVTLRTVKRVCLRKKKWRLAP